MISLPKRRLVTRSDFDGLVCAMILKELDLITDIKFVHPKDVQDGKVELCSTDITTNLPYDTRVGLAFDHHTSEMDRLEGVDTDGKLVIDESAKSAARVLYNYYGSQGLQRISTEILDAVDKGDSADFTIDNILNPSGWVLLHFITDARTGLGRFHDFRVSNYDLMMHLVDYCIMHSIDEVLQLPDVKERTDLYFEQQELFKEQLERLVKIEGTVGILDLRNEDTIYAGNRFMIYAMYPQIRNSVHVAWGFQKQNVAIMVGRSIINTESTVDIGDMCLKYGGGGHTKAGTCQIKESEVPSVLTKIIKNLNV